MTPPEHNRAHSQSPPRQLVACIFLLGGLVWSGCPSEPKPKHINSEDVPPAVEIDMSADEQAEPPKPKLVGILPNDFPKDLPVYIPASLVDFGESEEGRPTVSLLSPHSMSRVRRELYARLRDRGWQATSGGDGAVVLRKGAPTGLAADRGRAARDVVPFRVRIVNRQRAHPDLIEALRRTASRLAAGADYRWTHMGSCNCGHLAQTVTRLPKEEIHRLALEKAGNWGEQAREYREYRPPGGIKGGEYCPTSGYPIDHVLTALFELGLDRDDIWHLERLSDPDVLRRLPLGERDLDCRDREDTVLYMRTWADLLEDEWMAGIEAPR